MKKILALILTVCMISVMGITASADRLVRLVVGGEPVEADVAPMLVNDRTMLPVRAVFEAIGATVSYDDATQTVTAEKDGTIVKLVIGSDVMTINGEEKKIDVAAFTKNDRTFVPVRACAEAFDLEVDWFDTTHTVKIRTEVAVEAKEIMSGEGETEFIYDENGNLIEKRAYWGNTYYTYDENENLIEEKGPNRHEIYVYDNTGSLIEVKDGKTGEVRERHVNDANGNRVIWYAGDTFETHYEYDENGRVVHSKSDSEEFFRVYDARGNEIKTTRLKPGKDPYITDRTYDANGNIVREENNRGYWENYTYDEKGREIYQEDVDGNWKKTTYTDTGYREEWKSGSWIEYTTDEKGNVTLYRTKGGWLKKYTYDEKGFLALVEDNLGITDLGEDYVAVRTEYKTIKR